VESHITIRPSYGLTDQEIEQMLRDSIDHAREDEAARALREQQVEADRLLDAVVAALSADAALLSGEERSAIDLRMQELRGVRASRDARAIRHATELLEQATRDFAQRRMDANVRRALAGHRLDEFASKA
jgi:molecular chaperone HscA